MYLVFSVTPELFDTCVRASMYDVDCNNLGPLRNKSIYLSIEELDAACQLGFGSRRSLGDAEGVEVHHVAPSQEGI